MTPAGRDPVSTDGPADGPLFVLDGMSLAFRAYFALPADLSTEAGTVTNALHGFVSMLVNMVRDHHPAALAVAFDLEGPTFRDELVPDYKAGRAETPEDLPPQFEFIREVLASLNVPVVGVPGYEADDVLATLATQARDRGCDVVVVTGDRDSFQLVEDPHVKVLYNRRGVSDYALYDEAGIVERTGVVPAKYPMLASLRGDPSDNLPGVPGVGEKTAAKLLNTYDDLDGIFANLDKLSPKLRENLAANEALARTNLTAIPLVRDVPLGDHRRGPRPRRLGHGDGPGHLRAVRAADALAAGLRALGGRAVRPALRRRGGGRPRPPPPMRRPHPPHRSDRRQLSTSPRAPTRPGQRPPSMAWRPPRARAWWRWPPAGRVPRGARHSWAWSPWPTAPSRRGSGSTATGWARRRPSGGSPPSWARRRSPATR